MQGLLAGAVALFGAVLVLDAYSYSDLPQISNAVADSLVSNAGYDDVSMSTR